MRISGRVIFAACWAGMPKKAFAKIATPRKDFQGYWYQSVETALHRESIHDLLGVDQKYRNSRVD
jgi:hypothetical protein